MFVDGSYSFSLTDDQLLEHKLKVGSDITEERLVQLKDDSAFGKAYARALDLILRRRRSEKELRDYARRKEWSDELRDRVMNRLREKRYLDDKAFAESWVRTRAALKPSSRRKLTAELQQKGVASSIIQEVLTNDDTEHDELTALRQVVAKKQARYEDAQKFMAYLARQGFSYDAIKQVLSEETIL